MINRTQLRGGMTVRSSDGDKLGSIVAIDDQGFQVEKGIFFPKEYQANFDQVDVVSGNDIYLKWGTDLVEEQYDSFYGAGSYKNETADEVLWSDYARSSRHTEQTIPVREEAGRVKIHRTVRTKDQHFTVPNTREEGEDNFKRRDDHDLHP